jgi:hypothetical protein
MIYEEVFRYIIGVVINNNNKIRAVTNVLSSAEAEYKVLMDKYIYDTENDIKIYLFDFDKNTNIKEYDNTLDRC